MATSSIRPDRKAVKPSKRRHLGRCNRSRSTKLGSSEKKWGGRAPRWALSRSCPGRLSRATSSKAVWAGAATRRSMGRGVASWAVKIVDGDLAPDGALADRLRREADVLASIGGSGILPIQDAGRAGRLTYAASPLVRAQSLSDLMHGGWLSGEQTWEILSSVAEALDCAHRRGLVCRLLRPGHVLVDEGRVYLAEFGVASDRVGKLVMSSPDYHVTAPQYLAPEQVEGRAPDYRADIYALAVLVFEILTGTELQGARSPLEALRATLDGSPPSATERQPDLPSVSTSCSAARWRATP